MEKVNVNLYGRLAFATDLINGDKDGKKKAKLLMPKGTPGPNESFITGEQLWQTIQQVAQASFGQAAAGIDPKNMSMKDGDACIGQQSGQVYEGHAGCWRVAISSSYDFPVLENDPTTGQRIYVAPEMLQKRIYSGAWVAVSAKVSGYDFRADNGMQTKGVGVYINSILFVKDDAPLGGAGVSPEEAFANVGGLDFSQAAQAPAMGAPAMGGMPGGMPAPAGAPPMGMPAATAPNGMPGTMAPGSAQAPASPPAAPVNMPGPAANPGGMPAAPAGMHAAPAAAPPAGTMPPAGMPAQAAQPPGGMPTGPAF